MEDMTCTSETMDQVAVKYPKLAADMTARGWAAMHVVESGKTAAEVWESVTGSLSFHRGSRSLAKRFIASRPQGA